MKQFIFLIFVFAILLSACKPTPIYNEKQQILEKGWTHSDSLSYTFENSDLNTFFDIVLKIEHSVDYSWENIYINVNTLFPDTERTSQTLAIDFADLTGTWIGECSSNTCLLTIDLAKRSKFQQAGSYTLTIVQNSRQDDLKGIESMEIVVVPSSK